MSNIDFVITDDNSVGLFNNVVNDIYHSKTGAYKEALEKFVMPIISLPEYKSKKKFNVLDICYGIGYNSKCLLNNLENDAEVQIDALEYNKNLVCLSPFIKDSIIDDNLKIFILSELLRNQIEHTEIKKSLSNINNEFLTQNITTFIKNISSDGYKYNPQYNYYSFLHNIYYNYISNSMEYGLKANKYNNSFITYYFDDARRSIKSLKNEYDIVFLDAFSSQKDPTLWTIDFLSEIKNKMNNNSILVSYSKSTPFRSALVELGFYVGKTFIDEIDMGTIASLNENNIINPLTNYDIELLSTRSGITYKDSELNLAANMILKNRELEQNTSSRMSHTAFLKKHSD